MEGQVIGWREGHDQRKRCQRERGRPSFSGSNVGFELPNPTPGGGSITGSLAGSMSHESFAYSTTSATTAGTLCSPSVKNGKVKPAKGIKKLSVKSGTITLP